MNSKKKKVAELRKKAEKDLDLNFHEMENLSPEDYKAAIRELHVHQIELEMQNEELRKTQEELSEVRDKYADLFNFAPVGYLVLNSNNKIVDANLTACTMLGINRYPLLNMEISNILSPESQNTFYLFKNNILESKSKHTCEVKLIKKDKSEFSVLLECSPQMDKVGNISEIRIAVTDITERIKTENEIKTLAEEWKNTFNSIKDFVFILDNEHNFIRVNKSFCNSLKCGPEDIIGKKCYEILHKLDTPWHECPAVKTFKTKKQQTAEVEDKNIGVPLSVSTFPIFDDKGEIKKIVHIARNTTEFKKAMEQIQSLAKFPEENTNPVYRISKDGELLYVNSAAKKIIFEDIEKGSKIPEVWIRNIKDVYNSGKKQNYEFELKGKIYLLNQVPIIKGGYINTYAIDITKLKTAEKKLLLFNEVVDNSNDLIFVVNPASSKILNANNHASLSLGYSREELINKKVADIETTITDSYAWNDFIETIQEKEHLLQSTFLKRKDGTQFPVEVSIKILNILDKEYIIAIVRDISERKKSEDDLQKSRFELEYAHKHAMFMLAIASEYRDAETGKHIRRIVKMTSEIALKMGIPPELATQMGNDSLLHDLGKLGISDYILLKPGKLSDSEFETIKQHTVIGAKIIGDNKWFSQAHQIAMSHHERWDGSGYPEGLKGDAIPLAARIVAVADEYDALTSKRPYKEKWSKKKTIDKIKQESGTHFDPEVVKAFLSL